MVPIIVDIVIAMAYLGDKHITDAGTLAPHSACTFFGYENGGAGSVLFVSRGLNGYDHHSARVIS